MVGPASAAYNIMEGTGAKKEAAMEHSTEELSREMAVVGRENTKRWTLGQRGLGQDPPGRRNWNRAWRTGCLTKGPQEAHGKCKSI